MQRNIPLVNGEVYHIFNKSIAGYQIFNNQEEYFRMLHVIRYYQIKEPPCSFSDFSRLKQIDIMGFNFGRRLIETDEDFLHVSRYVHLNPTTAGLVKKPERWEYSSYREYLKLINRKDAICNEQDFVEIEPKEYKEFVDDQTDYQKELAQIKHLIME